MRRRVLLYKGAFLVGAAGVGFAASGVTTQAVPLLLLGLAVVGAAVIVYQLAVRGPGGMSAVAFASRSNYYQTRSFTMGLRDSKKNREIVGRWVAIAHEHGYQTPAGLEAERTRFGPLVKVTFIKDSEAT